LEKIKQILGHVRVVDLQKRQILLGDVLIHRPFS